MWFTVQVTEEDIRHGKRLDCMECPVARAVCRAVPVLPGLAFTAHDLCVLLGCPPWACAPRVHPRWRKGNSLATARWVRNFDLGRTVKPFTFRLNVPRQYVDLEALRVRTERAAEAAV